MLKNEFLTSVEKQIVEKWKTKIEYQSSKTTNEYHVTKRPRLGAQTKTFHQVFDFVCTCTIDLIYKQKASD